MSETGSTCLLVTSSNRLESLFSDVPAGLSAGQNGTSDLLADHCKSSSRSDVHAGIWKRVILALISLAPGTKISLKSEKQFCKITSQLSTLNSNNNGPCGKDSVCRFRLKLSSTELCGCSPRCPPQEFQNGIESRSFSASDHTAPMSNQL